MAITFTITEGDTYPKIGATLKLAGVAIPLRDAEVKFKFSKPGGTVLSRTCTITDETAATVEYQFVAADTATHGAYRGIFVITFADGKILSVPNDGYFYFTIYGDDIPEVEDYDLVTLDEVRKFLKLDLTDTQRDSFLQTCISLISAGVEEYCGTKIKKQLVENEIHNGDGESILYPKNNPVDSIKGTTDAEKLASVQYRTSPIESWTNLSSNAAYILIDPENDAFIELFDTVFPKGRSNIRISYYAGYDPVPAQIKKVVLQMVTLFYKDTSQSGDNRLGVSKRTESAGGTNVITEYKDVLPELFSVLDGYCRMEPAVRFVR
jgi:hypothetical protein